MIFGRFCESGDFNEFGDFLENCDFCYFDDLVICAISVNLLIFWEKCDSCDLMIFAISVNLVIFDKIVIFAISVNLVIFDKIVIFAISVNLMIFEISVNLVIFAISVNLVVFGAKIQIYAFKIYVARFARFIDKIWTFGKVCWVDLVQNEMTEEVWRVGFVLLPKLYYCTTPPAAPCLAAFAASTTNISKVLTLFSEEIWWATQASYYMHDSNRFWLLYTPFASWVQDQMNPSPFWPFFKGGKLENLASEASDVYFST